MPSARHIHHAFVMIFVLNLVCFTRALPATITQPLDQSQHSLGSKYGDLNGGKHSNNTRPFYAIAHRVLTLDGAKAAAEHGANAFEIDMTAWRAGWWADHDGTLTSYGDTAENMFKTIAYLRLSGKAIIFVWLDIKNPDYCDPGSPAWRHCSIDALRHLARLYLEPVGVRVLYGFYGSTVKRLAYRRVFEGLNSNEALNINGEASEVTQAFHTYGEPEKRQCIMSYGYFNLPFQFGTCREESFYTCTELRKGSEGGSFGQVFGWTALASQSWHVDELVGTAGVDGLIYGFMATHYYDHADTRNGIALIRDVVNKYSDRRHLAQQEDKPW